MKISFQELLEAVQLAIDAKYPPLGSDGQPLDPNNDYYPSCAHHWCIENIWEDRVFVSSSDYWGADEDPDYALFPFTIESETSDPDGDGDNDGPVITLGDLLPMKLVAVSYDGKTQVDVDLESHLINSLQVEAWDGSKSRFTVEQLLRAVPNAIARWARATAKKNNREVAKSDLSLPYKDPDGNVNIEGVRHALMHAPHAKGLPDTVRAAAIGQLKRVLISAKKRESFISAKVHGIEGATFLRSLVPETKWENLAGEIFTENLDAVIEGEYDEANMIIRGHKILGIESKNNRRYPIDVQKESTGVFEGAKAYLNHPKTRDASEARDVRDLIGQHRNIRVEASGTHSDLHLLDNPTVRDYVLPFVKTAPHLVGASVVVKALMKQNDDGIPEATKILACRSVDLVAEPATTNGLYESQGGNKNPQEGDNMEMKDLTLDVLKDKRPDLLKLIEEASLKTKNGEVETLRDVVKEQGEKLIALEVKDAQREKQTEVATLVAEAKVPDSLKYEEIEGKRRIKSHVRTMLEGCENTEARQKWIVDWEALAKDLAPSPRRTQAPTSTQQIPVTTENAAVGDDAMARLAAAL